MTTVIDPAGTPVPIFNRSGVTVVEIVAGSASGAGGAPPFPPLTPIPHVSGHTIAIVETVVNLSNAVDLPLDAEIGDLVEVHIKNYGQAANVRAQDGETINGAATPLYGGAYVGGYGFILLRKLTATDWRHLG